MHRPVRIAAPADTPVSLTEAKAHLDVTYTDKDALIGSILQAAVQHIDGWTGVLAGRCLVTQTWRQDFNAFSSCLRLPLIPVASISSVKYLDTSEVEQTITNSNYRLQEDEHGSFVRFDSDYSFPSVSVTDRPPVSVTYVAGTAAADVPAPIKQAILLLTRHWFDNPSAVLAGVSAQTTPLAVEALLSPFRRL